MRTQALGLPRSDESQAEYHASQSNAPGNPEREQTITPTINEAIHKPIPRLAEYEGLGGSRTQSTRRASNYAKAMASW
jgi:hypothetical protein